MEYSAGQMFVLRAHDTSYCPLAIVVKVERYKYWFLFLDFSYGEKVICKSSEPTDIQYILRHWKPI
jgi:hypothetical protein